jgi:hypothetical protein
VLVPADVEGALRELGGRAQVIAGTFTRADLVVGRRVRGRLGSEPLDVQRAPRLVAVQAQERPVEPRERGVFLGRPGLAWRGLARDAADVVGDAKRAETRGRDNDAALGVRVEEYDAGGRLSDLHPQPHWADVLGARRR